MNARKKIRELTDARQHTVLVRKRTIEQIEELSKVVEDLESAWDTIMTNLESLIGDQNRELRDFEDTKKKAPPLVM